MTTNFLNNPSIEEKTWIWQGFSISYQQAGVNGSSLILIHGFGASSGHWRKNIPVLAENFRVFAIDLIGYGKSAKPKPGVDVAGESINYRFETWGEQIVNFIEEIVQDSVFLVANSIGCVVSLQAAVTHPEKIKGVILLDCALRQIHDRKLAQQSLFRRLSRPTLKKVLANKQLVYLLYRQLAKPGVIKSILRTAYGNAEAVTDELVELIYRPSQDPGAADVFWSFINTFDGPLAEDLLPLLSCSALIIWGKADPWEPVSLGRKLGEYESVDRFIELEGVGHCPQDEVPDQVNAMIKEWIETKENEPKTS